MIQRAILIAFAWWGLTVAGMAHSQAAALAFPVLTGRVVDEAALLSASDRETLTAMLAELEAQTTDQLVIVTLKSLQGTTIEDYGYQLGRRWKIGQKDRDTGVLLIVAPTEKVVRIEVGYGLEGTLTDAMTKIIIETAILPAFKTGDFAGGIKSGANRIIQLLRPDAGNSAPSTARNSAPAQGTAGTPVWLVIVLGVGGVGLLIYCAIAGGFLCRAVMQMLILVALSGRRGSSNDRSQPFSGGGGSFGGGGSTGRW